MPKKLDAETTDEGGLDEVQENPKARFDSWTPRSIKKCDQANLPSQESRHAETIPPSSMAPRAVGPTPVALGPSSSTLHRQESERRERLCPLDTCSHERRPLPKGRRKRAKSASPDVKPKTPIRRGSFPDIRALEDEPEPSAGVSGGKDSAEHSGGSQTEHHADDLDLTRLSSHTLSNSEIERAVPDLESLSDALNDAALRARVEAEWVLSLSMHFRDGSDREKFFVTYIERPNRWRRVTISCDYRGAPDNSLEDDLKSLHYQRDKNIRIYQAIKDSLPDIQFYDTVTNLKLETSDKRLHVHVTEDMNEIINYPPISAIEHLRFEVHGYQEVRERDLMFESHLSGFVYKVSTAGKVYIEKEISSPDTVEEFLYEINALAALSHSRGVIELIGVVIDNSRTFIKGLLIRLASGGSLSDFLFENRDEVVPWSRRVKWARQIVAGIADIHEAGFIQGDCTISNVVLDANDDAKIVDINRRGCPIGWEPPEFEGLIRSGQRISMYIGVKSDLFQLGMILWAIAKQSDEPEREERPLRLDSSEYPEFFKTIVHSCLADNPDQRTSAKQLLTQFPSAVYDESGEIVHLKNHIMPNYEEQKQLLAGIGLFGGKDASTGPLEPLLKSEMPSRRPAHQDSGLGFLLDDNRGEVVALADVSGSIQAVELYEDREGPFGRSMSHHLPIHQDSGFVDSTFPNFAIHRVSNTPLNIPAGFQRDLLINTPSGSLHATGGAHSIDVHEQPEIPRFATPPHI